jgi:hypothetical protein
VSARRRFARPALALLLAAMALGACGGSTSTTTVVTVPASPTTGPSHDQSSPVKLTLVSPKNDEVVSGSSVHVTLTISGGTIDAGYSKNISPTVGHIHLYLNSELVAMSYATGTDLPVDPGAEYSLYAEWVASDHGSFTPRDITPKIYFTVATTST